MQDGRTKRSMGNIVFGVLNRAILMLFPFAIKTIMIQTLGAQYLGLNSLFTSILQVLSLSELGVGSAMVYSMYKPVAEGDKKTVCALLRLYKTIYTAIGLVILAIGLCLLPFLEHLIADTYPQEVNIYLLYLIYLGNTVITYLMFAYKKSILEANQINSVESKLNAAVNIVLHIAQIGALLLTRNYYVYIIFLPLSTVALNICRYYAVTRMFPEYKPEGKLDSSVVKSIGKKVTALVGHKIGTTVVTSADSIVISAFLGLTVLAKYSNYHYIINSIIGFVTIFYTSTTASIGNSLISESREKNYRDFKMLTFINLWIVGWCAVCLTCLYQPFMELWMGRDMMFDFSTVVLFVVFFYSWLFRRIGLTYKDAAGMWNEDALKPYVGSIVNLLTNIVLVKIIGVKGVIIATIVIMLFIYAPWETYVLFAKLFKRSPMEYIFKLLIYTLCTFLAAAATYFICGMIPFGGLGGLAVKAALCVVVPNAAYIALYHRTNEFNDVLLKLRQLGLLKKLTGR